jgi:glutamate decarboxylase
MEPHAEKLMMETMAKNIIDAVSLSRNIDQGTSNNHGQSCSETIGFPFGNDQEEYPASQDLSNRCVNMIARLFNAPVNNPDDESLGVSTIGSSEGTSISLYSHIFLGLPISCLPTAIILATLAMKRKWQAARKAAGKPHHEPNIVMNSAVQVCT